MLSEFIDFILHVEEHLRTFIENHGFWVYVLLFAIVFCETGLVITPFLPGDSLLFAVGTLAVPLAGQPPLLDWKIVVPLLLVAAILGDAVNYSIGKWFGPKVFSYKDHWLLRQDHLRKAHDFYEKYGGRAIVLARFVPIVRTFAPFIAGVGTMEYRRFAFYNISGAIVWVGLFVGGGYAFGNLPFVQNNMKAVIMGIIVVSVLPIVWEMWKAKFGKKPETA